MVTSLVMLNPFVKAQGRFGRSIRLCQRPAVWAQILRAAQDDAGKGEALETTPSSWLGQTEKVWRFWKDVRAFQGGCYCHAELQAKHLAEPTSGGLGTDPSRSLS